MNIGYKIKVHIARLLLLFLYRKGRYIVTGEHRVEKLMAENQSFIIAIWHGQLLTAFMRHAYRGNVAMAGTHRDASLITDIGELMNWRFVRGSSSEGGAAALKGMVKELKKPGTVFLITPDGPKGPSHIVKSGVIKAAQLTGVPVIPAAGQATRRWEFKNWDIFYTAKPFSRIHLCFGEPITIARNANKDVGAEKLQLELNRLTQIVNERCGD